jgi:tryptophan synthase beta chain
MEPVKPEALLPIFAKELLGQEVSAKRSIDIPEEVREAYRMWRPTPLIRATRLEKQLKTPAHIYYKYEGVSPTGSHKPNTAVPQAYFNMKQGIERLTTETGAGQWGSSLAFAGNFFDLNIEIFMVRVSYD